VAPVAPGKPGAPKAEVLNAFDIFGLPAEAPAAAPTAAETAAQARKVLEEDSGSNTLSLNAADLFGGAVPTIPKSTEPGAQTTGPSAPVNAGAGGVGAGGAGGAGATAGSASQPAIEPPLPGREPKPGQVYGTLRLIRRLGEGNMAIVFLAERVEGNQKLAVKFLKPEVAANQTSVKRFVREAESAQKIKHPNVLETYRVAEYRGWHFMEMELMAGEDIRALMKRGTVPVAQALTLCLAAASGLQAAHDQGVIHRDIKPENLMIMDGGRLKIADFGLARVQEAQGLTMPGQMLGTPAYMAPEQWEGKPPDARTDIYALGVTLYDMITARRPVEGTTAGAIIQTLFGKGPTPIEQVNPALPKSVIELVNQMVKVSPDDRPATMAEVKARLQAALQEVTSASDPALSNKKDESLGATMVTDEATQARLKSELKNLPPPQDAEEATMKMAPGELEKVLSSAPSDGEKAESIAKTDEPTLAMSAEDVEQMQRQLAETELKKDGVKSKTDDGGVLRKILIAAIILVALLIFVVVVVVIYVVYFVESSTTTWLHTSGGLFAWLASLL
ncbi:MAG: serine/threonine-protein kinase, partial [Planctomycetota bacterium]